MAVPRTSLGRMRSPKQGAGQRSPSPCKERLCLRASAAAFAAWNGTELHSLLSGALSGSRRSGHEPHPGSWYQTLVLSPSGGDLELAGLRWNPESAF